MHHAIRRFVRKIWRSWAYAKLGWKNEDWDFTYFFDLLAFKFRRMEKYMRDDMVDSPGRDKSVRIARKLANRLAEDHYHYGLDAHDRKWGELTIEFAPREDGFSEMLSHRANAVTKRAQRKERIEFMVAANQDDARRSRDLRWLTQIIEKHAQHWWS